MYFIKLNQEKHPVICRNTFENKDAFDLQAEFGKSALQLKDPSFQPYWETEGQAATADSDGLP